MTDVRKKAKRVVSLTSKSGKKLPVPRSLRGIMADAAANATVDLNAGIEAELQALKRLDSAKDLSTDNLPDPTTPTKRGRKAKPVPTTMPDAATLESEPATAKRGRKTKSVPAAEAVDTAMPDAVALESEPATAMPDAVASECDPTDDATDVRRGSAPKLIGAIMDATLPKPSITRMWSGTNWADFASATMDQKQLCGPLWYEGEICILFADTNVGKSLLAVQIADMVSNGSYCDTSLPELKPETMAQPVVYADFELSIAQFGRRYSAPHPEDETRKVYYDFSPRFNRVELYYDMDSTDDTNGIASKEFADQLISDLELHLDACRSRVLIIDNITFMASGTETAADAMPLMKRLVALKKKRGMSILLLAHTPKRSLCNPLTRNDLQGSKMLINFADSAFAIGESNCGKDVRYIKQIKQRNCEQVYDGENVLVCQLGKVYENFIGFRSIGTGLEATHLAERRPEGGRAATVRTDKMQQVRELKQQGMTADQIASEIGVSRATAYRMVKEVQ